MFFLLFNFILISRTTHEIAQVCYEVIRDIPAGRELLAAPKVPLQLNRDSLSNGSHDHYSDKETGEHKHTFFLLQYTELNKRKKLSNGKPSAIRRQLQCNKCAHILFDHAYGRM